MVTDIVSLTDVFTILGIEQPDPNSQDYLRISSLHRRAESLVKKAFGCSIKQATYTHYLPTSRTRALGKTLWLPEYPVRDVTDLREDLTARAGQRAGAFPASTALTQGEQFMVEYDDDTFSYDHDGNPNNADLDVLPVGRWGKLHRTHREWPTFREFPGSLKITYVAGWSASELAGSVPAGHLDASAIRSAVLEFVMIENYRVKGLTAAVPGIRSESVDGWSASYGESDMIKYSAASGPPATATLPDSILATLRPFIRPSITA